MWQWFALWAACLSLAEFILMGVDKHRAKTNKWRMRERTLLLVALLGGAPGGLLGMYLFRHKTKHWQFKYGLPLFALLYLLAAWCLIHLY